MCQLHWQLLGNSVSLLSPYTWSTLAQNSVGSTQRSVGSLTFLWSRSSSFKAAWVSPLTTGDFISRQSWLRSFSSLLDPRAVAVRSSSPMEPFCRLSFATPSISLSCSLFPAPPLSSSIMSTLTRLPSSLSPHRRPLQAVKYLRLSPLHRLRRLLPRLPPAPAG